MGSKNPQNLVNVVSEDPQSSIDVGLRIILNCPLSPNPSRIMTLLGALKITRTHGGNNLPIPALAY